MIAMNQGIAALRAGEAAFAAKNPDYYEALEHARNIRREQLKIFAPEAEEAAIEGELTRQELATAFGLLQREQNPAERAYAYAKTLGYTKQQAQAAAASDGGKQDASSQARDDKGQFRKQPTPEELAAAKAASATLGAGGDDPEAVAAEQSLEAEQDIFEQARTERFGKQ